MEKHMHSYDFVNPIKLRCQQKGCDSYVIILESALRFPRLLALEKLGQLAPNGDAAKELVHYRKKKNDA